MTGTRLVLCCLAAAALQAAPLSIPRVGVAPVVDGAPEDAAWGSAAWQSGFRVLGQPDVAAVVPTRFKLVHDGSRLYGLLEAEEPDAAGLRLASRNLPDDTGLWNDDSLELYLDPGGRGDGYFQFIVTWKGTLFDGQAEDDNRGMGTFALQPEWNAEAQAAARVAAGCWRAEISIPFAALGLRADLPPVWGVNVCRNRYAGNTAEHSACVPLPPDRGFGQPSRYLRAVLTDFAPAPFQWAISRPEIKVGRQADALLCEVRTTLQNQTGEFCILALTAELAGQRAVRELDLKHLQEAPVSFALPFAAPGDYRLRLALARRAAPAVVLARLELPVRLDYQPLRLQVLEPAYRNCIFASQHVTRVLARITAEPGVAGLPLTVSLAGAGSAPLTQTFASVGPARDVEFPAAALPEGRYALSAAVAGAPTVTCELRKLPHVAGEVWLDERGNTYVDGAPFLPFGWYSAPPDKEPEMTALQTYGLWSDVSAIRRTLDAAQKGGKKLLLIPFQGEKAWDDPITNQARRGAFTREQAERVRYVVDAIKDHPAILGWYMADEPEGSGHSVEWYKAAYALLREIDPHHPCIMLNYGLSGIRTYHEGCDILMPDCYPVFRCDGTTSKPLWALTEWTTTARALRPTWLVPQVFDWDGTGTVVAPGRPPTFDEVRNQVWQILAAGGRGILMYSYNHDSRTSCDLRLGPAYIAREAQACRAALFGESLDAVQVTTTPADPHFAAALCRAGDGSLLLIAVNTSCEPRTVRFGLGVPVPGDTLHVVGEQRTVTLAAGGFAEEFPAVATRLYSTDRALAEPFDLAGMRAAIAAADKARLKPGNLVGLGGLPRHRLKELAAAAPEGRPVITYSSRLVLYSNRGREWDILYLLDGLSRDVLHNSWSPRSDDQSPWLEVALPSPGPVGRVTLYTPSVADAARLHACRVLLRRPDGTLEPVAELAKNTSHELQLRFAARTARAVRVEMTGVNPRLEGSAETGLVTEIEVYAE